MKCRNCGSNSFKEICNNIVASTEIVMENEMKHGETSYTKGNIDHYECSRCGQWLYADGAPVTEIESFLEAA